MKNNVKKWLNLDNSIVLSLTSFLLAILVSCVIMALSGHNPIFAYQMIFEGSFGSMSAISQTLIQATPLILTGLAFMFAKKSTMINLGVEGQLYCGAIVTAIVAMTPLNIPPILHIIFSILAGIVAGGIAGAIVALLKVKFGSNEVITTTMINFIIISFTDFLVNYTLKAEGPVAQTDMILEFNILPKIFPQYQLTIAILFAIATAFIVKFILDKTKIGYELKAVGKNQKASETAGIKVGKVMIFSMFTSGAIAGLAGSLHILGVSKRFIAGFSPGYGFSGISVAALASDSALGIILSGIVFGALKAGSMYLNMTSRIPVEFVSVIQALVVIFVSSPLLIKSIMRHKKGGNK